MNPLDRQVVIPTTALESPGTADEIAERSSLPVWPVWRALQRDVRTGRVKRVTTPEGVTMYALADRKKRPRPDATLSMRKLRLKRRQERERKEAA